MRRKVEYLLAAMAVALFMMPAPTTIAATPADQCRFIGIHSFAEFVLETNAGGRALVSPIIKAPIQWNQLIVSWNAFTPPNTWLKVEARGIYPDRQTKYYSLGTWSMDPPGPTRESEREQKDADGDVHTDTLVMQRAGADVQLRITLGATNQALAETNKNGSQIGEGSTGAPPELRFVGLSFIDTHAQVEPLVSDHTAWGKIITTPERSQNSYPQEEGWCSPTSLSMALDRWSEILGRPEMNLDVPEIAAAIFDPKFPGTGNWAFNCAFAGSFPGMRAYVTRLTDLTEVETWINAGIPVILSARWNLLSPGRKDTGSGHLVVCIGFTENGEVVINDPATNLQKGQHVRHIYTRENVMRAWGVNHNTVYLIYPETTAPPADPFGHWDKQ